MGGLGSNGHRLRDVALVDRSVAMGSALNRGRRINGNGGGDRSPSSVWTIDQGMPA